MFGATLTLLNRSLRVDTRLMRSHLMRFFLLLIILWLLFTAQTTGSFFGAPGLRFFSSISTMNFLFITLAGISFFATAITEEKEEMTLGLLRMAGVNHVSILLGKSTARLVGAILLLAAQFPFTLLAITLGGVTSHQVVATYFALLAYMVMLANVALFFSVVSKRSNGASWSTGLLIGMFFLGTPLAQWALSSRTGRGVIDPNGIFAVSASTFLGWLRQASIFDRLQIIKATGFAASTVSIQVVSNLVAAVVFFGLSWAVFNRFIGDDLPAAPARGLLFKRRFVFGLLGCGRVWGHPLIWKDFHFITGGKPMLLGKFLLYGLLIVLVVNLLRSPFQPAFDHKYLGAVMMWCMFVALLVESALLSGRIFREESKWKTLSSIVLLPCSILEIAYSKIAGCLITLIPAAAWFFVGCLLNPREFGEAVEETLGEAHGWYVIVQYILFLHLSALLSLYVKWGAVPLAFALVYVVNGFCLSFATFSGFAISSIATAEKLFIVLNFLGLAATLALHVATGNRLKTLAAA